MNFFGVHNIDEDWISCSRMSIYVIIEFCFDIVEFKEQKIIY
jgi:hypothetical protein